MANKLKLALAFVLLFAAAMFAHRGLGLKVEYEIGKTLVAQNVSCENLSDFELEMIGDYYLETKYPGDYHRLIDSGFGSRNEEEINQFHRDVAYEYYCQYQPVNQQQLDFVDGTYSAIQLLQLLIVLGVVYLIYKIITEIIPEMRREKFR